MKGAFVVGFVISAFLFFVNAESAPETMPITAKYDEQGHISEVAIDRGKGNVETVKFSLEEAVMGFPEIHLAALNAYMSYGKATDVPLKFANGKELVDFALTKNRNIEGSISNPVVKDYISNLKTAYTLQSYKTAECKVKSKLFERSRSGAGSPVTR